QNFLKTVVIREWLYGWLLRRDFREIGSVDGRKNSEKRRVSVASSPACKSWAVSNGQAAQSTRNFPASQVRKGLFLCPEDQPEGDQCEAGIGQPHSHTGIDVELAGKGEREAGQEDIGGADRDPGSQVDSHTSAHFPRSHGRTDNRQ